MDDTVVKKELPVHLILGTSEYAQIKTETMPKVGKAGEPIAELTAIDQHLDNLQHVYPNEVEEIRRSLYVDDLIGGERTVADAWHLRQALQSIFRAG